MNKKKPTKDAPKQEQLDALGYADPLDGDVEEIALSSAEKPKLSEEDERKQRQEQRRQMFGQEIAGMVTMVSKIAEGKTKINGLALQKVEHDQLAEAVQDCADEYLGSMGTIPPWVDLLLVSAAISVPRYLMVKDAVKASKAKPVNQEGEKDAEE